MVCKVSSILSPTQCVNMLRRLPITMTLRNQKICLILRKKDMIIINVCNKRLLFDDTPEPSGTRMSSQWRLQIRIIKSNKANEEFCEISIVTLSVCDFYLFSSKHHWIQSLNISTMETSVGFCKGSWTLCGRDVIAAISQTTFLNAFSWKCMNFA